MSNKAIFVISIDTELAWGSFDKGISSKKLESIKKARYCINKLIDLFERYNTSATWALVGHLMLEGCEVNNDVKYPDIVRPNHQWFNGDWFKYVPILKEDSNSIWYGKDILEKILSCKISQEIASHSFSHIILGDEGCTEECAESDIKKCVEVAKELNISLTSFVFPRNSEGYIHILKKYGFKVYRGDGQEWYKNIKNVYIKKIGHFLDELFSITPKTYIPELDANGLYNIRGSQLYFSREGIRKLVPIKSRVYKAKKGIDKAILKNEIFHIWFHPFNLGTDADNLLKGFEEILRYAKEKIDEGLLENLTMSEIVRKPNPI